MSRPRRLDLFESHLVVSDHPQLDRRVDLAEPLHEVVGERVVIVDQKDHEGTACHTPTTAEVGEPGSSLLFGS